MATKIELNRSEIMKYAFQRNRVKVQKKKSRAPADNEQNKLSVIRMYTITRFLPYTIQI